MRKGLTLCIVLLLTAFSVFAGGASDAKGADGKTVITIWYEGNDSRLPFFKAAEAEMQKDYPDYSINAVTFDNATLVTRSLQAATATGGVDLIFNEASRLLTTYQQSGGAFEDLSDVLAASPNSETVTDADKKVCSSGDKLIVYPVNRSVNALGYKTDIIEVSEDQAPSTWEKFVELGKRYEEAGINGWTLHLGTDPKQAFNLFLTGGNGMTDLWLDTEANASKIDENKELFAQIIDLYTGEDAIWDPDAINEDFAAMYTKIQSGSVGMFRVGNWNVVGWDQPDSGVGEYVTTTWPSLYDSGKGGLLLGGVRGMAMPSNAPEKEAAKIFLQYCMTEAAQKASFDTMGSCMDYSVVDMDSLTENQKIFFDSDVTIYPADCYEGAFPYYPQLLEVFERGLTEAYSADGYDEVISILEKTDAAVNQVFAENN